MGGQGVAGEEGLGVTGLDEAGEVRRAAGVDDHGAGDQRDAAAAGADARRYEAALLKTLGASRRSIATSFLLRAGLLGLFAGAVALLAGILGGWAVSRFVMETRFEVVWPSALLIVLGGATASVLASLGFALNALNVRPAGVLRARE